MLILLCYASVFVLMYLLYSYTVLSLCLKSTSRYWCTVSLNDNEQPFCSLLIHCPCSGGHVAQHISVANSGQCVHIKGRSRSLSAQWRARHTALHPVQLWASPGRWLSRDEGPPTHPLSRFGGGWVEGPLEFFFQEPRPLTAMAHSSARLTLCERRGAGESQTGVLEST